ncbi:hypothetical protein [Chamaesiphon sp. VAR_69_metabat_338]|uniref:hypothetical protein n=1 Tax=Chamaesiphon sp. VAR_69_metabat_338 TaxID=2964704 RepID=UPI00286E0DBB|nr:hypothetical protein [Chamaesiphon sp. VAR_69_metabat_338]
MLKIWLTWLQPSLGVLGTALLLSSTLCVRAATKPVSVSLNRQAPAQVSPWSKIKSSGTRIDRELVNRVAPTPDLAVRQLAVSSMAVPAVPAPSAAIEIRPHRRTYASSVISPSLKSLKQQQLSAKANKFQPQNRQNNDVASALSQAINPSSSPIPVPGIYIGNSNGNTANKFAPKTASKLATKTVVPSTSVATEIGAPTPLSAMMAAKTAVDPFPVVRPELMQKLDRMPVTASVPTIDKTAPAPLNPIAAIPTQQSKTGLSTVVSPKSIAPVQSLDPIAAIPSGLQRLLGNNLNSQPTAIASDTTASAPKTSSMVALTQFISPTVASVPSASVNAASLQLATAQAYNTASTPKFSIPGETLADAQTYTANVPKFSIPGETLLTAKPLKSVVNLAAVTPSQQSLTTTATVTSRKSTYVSSSLTPVTPKQSWLVVNQRNNLGGLILGSQQLAAAPRVASLLPGDTSASVGLPVKALVDVN